MKHLLSMLLFIGCWSGWNALGDVYLTGIDDDQSEIKVGDSREDVVELMGQPPGTGVFDGREILMYDNGQIDIVDGKVAEVRILTEAEVKAKKDAEEARAAKIKALRAQLLKQGQQEKADTLADDGFQKKSASAQLKYWQQFQKKYPGVSVGNEIARLKNELKAAQAVSAEARLKAYREKKAAEIGAMPKLSTKKRRKLQRSGKWVWNKDGSINWDKVDSEK